MHAITLLTLLFHALSSNTNDMPFSYGTPAFKYNEVPAWLSVSLPKFEGDFVCLFPDMCKERLGGIPFPLLATLQQTQCLQDTRVPHMLLTGTKTSDKLLLPYLCLDVLKLYIAGCVSLSSFTCGEVY